MAANQHFGQVALIAHCTNTRNPPVPNPQSRMGAYVQTHFDEQHPRITTPAGNLSIPGTFARQSPFCSFTLYFCDTDLLERFHSWIDSVIGLNAPT